MSKCVVNVSTTEYYRKGQKRLMGALNGADLHARTWPAIPAGWPSQQDKPYAMKAYAMREAAEHYDLLLWCDASILPIRSLEPLWERIERDGYWFSKNGWNNYEWTADAAYPDLFAEEYADDAANGLDPFFQNRRMNKGIPHVVATSFGLNVKHPIGKAFLDEYYRLASETRAFCGPWINTAHPSATPMRQERWRYGACGPADVRGHRHDQTAASVIAWRLGMQLSDPPSIFAYSKRRPDGTLHLEDQDERTILLADGAMETGLHA